MNDGKYLFQNLPMSQSAVFLQRPKDIFSVWVEKYIENRRRRVGRFSRHGNSSRASSSLNMQGRILNSARHTGILENFGYINPAPRLLAAICRSRYHSAGTGGGFRGTGQKPLNACQHFDFVILRRRPLGPAQKHFHVRQKFRHIERFAVKRVSLPALGMASRVISRKRRNENNRNF